MYTQELPIQEALKGESYGDKVIYNSDAFKAELHKYGVKNLFDSELKIKQDGEKYIFAINGTNKFAINGTVDLRMFIEDFYKDLKEQEKRATNKEAVIDVSEFEKKTKVEITITETEKDLAELEDQILKNKELNEKATDINELKKRVENLIIFFEQEKDLVNDETSGWIFNQKYDKKDKGLWKMQKTEIKRRLEKLNKIKDQITRLENNKDKKYTIERDNENDVKEVKMDNINGFDMKVTVKQLSDKIEELGKEAPDFIIARNTIIAEEGDTTPYYELILSDKSDVRKLTRILNRINKEYVQIDKLSLTAAKRQALQQDLLKLQEYLQGYINDPNKPLEPFIPKSGDAFEKLCAIDPELASLGKLNKKANKPTEGNPNSTYNDGTTETAPGNTENNNINTTNNPNTNVVNDRDFSDKNYIETFKEGGIKGILRKTLNMFPNMSAQSKNTWTNLLVVGGVGFGIFKLAKWLFSGKRKKGQAKTPFRQRLLIVGGVTLGFNAFGTNPLKFAEQFIGGGLDPKTLKVQRPRAKTNVEDPTKELNVIELNEIFGSLPISKLKEFIDPKTFKLTEAGHNGLLLNFQGNDENSKTKRELIEKMRTNKDNDILKTSFAKIGITPDNINNLNQDKTIKEYTEASAPTIESDTRDGVDDPRINITNQVKDFNLTTEQKENLVKYGNILYDEKPSSSEQKVEFKEKDTKIYLKTYGERTMIDPEKLTMIGYNKDNTSPIVFSGYKELIKAANLTNYLKSIFRGKAKGTQYTPFESAGLVGKLTWDRGDIMFNDGTSSYNPTHTEAIDGGRFGTLGTISPKLEQNKEEYIKYLNNMNIWNESRSTEDKPTS